MKKLELVKKDLEAKNLFLKEQSREKGTLRIELKAARAAIGRAESVVHGFAERV